MSAQMRQPEPDEAPPSESLRILLKLKREPGNNVCFDCGTNPNPMWACVWFGIFLCEPCSGIHRSMGTHISFIQSVNKDIWKWEYLRTMKVGGNESAAKFYKSHGGSALLKSAEVKARYVIPKDQQPTAVGVKYRQELANRSARDLAQFGPTSVGIIDDSKSEGTSTPAGEPTEEFFSEYDKPQIKKPTQPTSRSGTPPVIGRTPSPFLKAGKASDNGSDIARAASPLANQNGTASATSRTTTSAALRKTTTTTTGPRKPNVLGSKKTKLGAKKVAGDVIDFEAAERKAKEEAERIEKLGYDPDAEETVTKKPSITTKSADLPNVASPTPISPGRSGYGTAAGRERANSEMERLGMGIGRLGFGQVGGNKPAPTQKKMGGFGSVGPTKAMQEDDEEKYARQKFGSQKGISSDEFFGKGAFDPNAQSEAKQRLQGFEGATSISSNAYFGRPEEDNPGEEYGDLETAAKDFVRKFGVTAGDDLENLTQVLGEGASKLQGAIRSYLNS